MDEDEHYNIYTLINTGRLKELPEKLSPVLEAFTIAERLEPVRDCNSIFEYKGDKFYDLQTYFKMLNAVNDNIAEKETQTFFDWCDTQLIEKVSFKDYNLPDNENFKPADEFSRSGLSIYVPCTKDELGSYDFLPLYKQTNLADFHKLTLNKE